MAEQAVSEPHLSNNGIAHIKAAVDKLSSSFPGCFLVIASPDKVLFSHQSGPFDVLHRDTSRPVKDGTIVWASSATRFVTVLGAYTIAAAYRVVKTLADEKAHACTVYLQLVDHGLITLDTPVSKYSPDLEKVSRQILRGFDDNGQPIFEPSAGNITLRQILNGTSGFAAEYESIMKKWRDIPNNAHGWINSCKLESLIHTPPASQPGEVWKYGTSHDWLSYLFPRIANQDFEEYLRENIFRPLDIKSASFYPHDSDLKDRVMPLRWLTQTTEDEKHQFDEWTGQQPSHFLPQGRANIEYPTGGAALYCTTADLATVLQNILAGYLHKTTVRVISLATFTPLLSPELYRRIRSPDLEPSQVTGVEDMLSAYFHFSAEEGDTFLTTENVNVNLGGLPMIVGEERKGGWGRRSGAGGWGGAAGTDFYIDPVTGIAVVFSAQLLPGSGPVVKGCKKGIERAIFEALEKK